MNDQAGIGHNNPPSELELLVERLNEEQGKLCEVVNKRIQNALRAPKVCPDDNVAGKITDMMALLNNAHSECERVRKIEKQPFWDQGIVVDKFFNEMKDKLITTRNGLEKPLKKFQLDKAEAIRKEAALEAERNRLAAEKHNNAGVALQNEGMEAAAGVSFAESEAYDRRAETMEQTAIAKPSQIVQTRTSAGATASLKVKQNCRVANRKNIDWAIIEPFLNIDDLEVAGRKALATGITEIRGFEIFDDVKIGVRKRG